MLWNRFVLTHITFEVHCKWGMRKDERGEWEADPDLCPATMKQSQVAAHEAGCPFAVVRCGLFEPQSNEPFSGTFCRRYFRQRDVAEHRAHCEYRRVPCPHQGCNFTPSWSCLNRHAENCPHRPIECKNEGCNMVASKAAMAAHRAVCGRERIICKYADCHQSLLREEMPAHEETEMRYHLTCEYEARLAAQQALNARPDTCSMSPEY